MKCKLDLVGAQDTRWDKSGTEPADGYEFSMEHTLERWETHTKCGWKIWKEMTAWKA
jgi:hypothetical protein